MLPRVMTAREYLGFAKTHANEKDIPEPHWTHQEMLQLLDNKWVTVLITLEIMWIKVFDHTAS